ncbi:epoxyqueuosine reductase QueH [Enterococcus cecorum]|nr:epoxyqueuosine reductase QueH [Enterococcus cecorum]
MLNADMIVEKMKNQKINYDRVLRKMIIEWEKNEERPRILLHSCCATCSTYTLEFLCQYADVTVFFSNSNIHPESEYLRRMIVQKKFIEDFNANTGNNVQLIVDEYKPNDFIQMMVKQNLHNEKEGGKRCDACFNLRLDLVAQKAQELGYDYFGSALTISPKKNSQLINQIGMDIQKIYNTNYLPSDFKKNQGYQRSIEMCKEYDVFRQCYCGCVFAAKQQGIDFKAIKKEAQEYVDNYEKENGKLVFTFNAD